MALSKDEIIVIVNGFVEMARRTHDVQRVYLFGSFAKGTAKGYSDVDVAIVLGSIDPSEESPFDERFRIFHEAQQYNSLLEVVCFHQEEFDRDGGSLVRQIKKEGIRLI
jgi:predicted nucleotidyltransferase